MTPEPLTTEAFAPFGAVIEARGEGVLINDGFATRFDALALVDPGPGSGAAISLFKARRWPQPIRLAMLERHPLASQAFMPLGPSPWLVAVAGGEAPGPGDIRLFRARGDQGVQIAAGIWHHPLLILADRQDFVVVDRADQAGNLELRHFAETDAAVIALDPAP